MSLAFSLIEICDLLKALRLLPALGGNVTTFFLVSNIRGARNEDEAKLVGAKALK